MRRAPIPGALILVLAALAASLPLAGQGGVLGSPVSEEEAVRSVLEQVFRGMRQADSAMVRATFDPGARFASATPEGGVRYDAVDGWIRAIATSGGRWDERIYDVRIEVDPPVASAWVPYTFYLDGEVSHCGANTVELLRTAAGWKITQLSDSRRREGCPDPLGQGNGEEVVERSAVDAGLHGDHGGRGAQHIGHADALRGAVRVRRPKPPGEPLVAGSGSP